MSRKRRAASKRKSGIAAMRNSALLYGWRERFDSFDQATERRILKFTKGSGDGRRFYTMTVTCGRDGSAPSVVLVGREQCSGWTATREYEPRCIETTLAAAEHSVSRWDASSSRKLQPLLRDPKGRAQNQALQRMRSAAKGAGWKLVKEESTAFGEGVLEDIALLTKAILDGTAIAYMRLHVRQDGTCLAVLNGHMEVEARNAGSAIAKVGVLLNG